MVEVWSEFTQHNICRGVLDNKKSMEFSITLILLTREYLQSFVVQKKVFIKKLNGNTYEGAVCGEKNADGRRWIGWLDYSK